MSGSRRWYSELKRRRVFRVATVYAAAGFVVWQAADIAFPALGLPEWLMTAAVALTLLGFPVAIALAWAFDMTPDGVVRTEPQGAGAAAAGPVPALLGRRAAVLSGALILLGVGLGAGWVLKPVGIAGPGSLRPATTVMDRSIAVLPFADLSEARDQRWFAEGLAEEILTSLARLPELRVIGRNSSFLFTDGATDDQHIAGNLGVAHLVKGSVRRVGGQLRVTAQLVRAADGVQLWSESYDRRDDDLLHVQRDVAEKVAAALDVLLDDDRRERMFAAGTRNVEAFEAFVRGREIHIAVHGEDRTRTLADAGIWLGRAMELDPGFARPALLSADRWAHQVMDGPGGWVGPTDLSQEEAIAQLRRDLDHAARAATDAYERTVAELNRELFAPVWHRLPGLIDQLGRHAAAGNPNLDDLWGPLVLTLTGQLDLLRQLATRTLRSEPLEPIAWFEVINVELSAGHLDEARSLLADARRTAGDHRYLRDAELILLMLAGDREAVLARLEGFSGVRSALLAAVRGEEEAAFERAAAIDHASSWPPSLLLLVYHELGDRQRSRELVQRIDSLPAGPAILARQLWLHGRALTFDLADAPNFSARLAEAGVDPGSFRVMPRLSASQGDAR
jgi:TolB-like protein